LWGFLKRRKKTIAALIGILIVGAAVYAVESGLAWQYFKLGPDYTNFPAQTSIKVMPTTSPEYSEVHIKGADGQDAEVDILFRNNDRGYKYVRNGNLAEYKLTYPDGSTRADVFYAKDGRQVVRGFARRADHSMLFQAVTTNGVVTLATYWADGTQLFSIDRRKVGDSSPIETTYYRADGTKWDYKEGSIEEVFNDQGKLSYELNTAGSNTTITYFHDDGKAAYRETFSSYTQYYGGYEGEYEDEGGYGGSTTQVVTKLEEFAADGKTVTIEYDFSSDGTKLTGVIVPDGNGGKLAYQIADDGRTAVRYQTMAVGQKTWSDAVELAPADQKVFDPPKDELQGQPSSIDLQGAWQKAETDPTTKQEMP
jgi:hypothetical protein